MSSLQKLILRYRDESGERQIPISDKMVIGRNPGCNIVLADGNVSGKHAAIVSKGDRWFVADLDSSNGVFVDGDKVKQAQLKSGDQFRIGSTVFAVSAGVKSSQVVADAPGADLVVRRTNTENVEPGGSVALQTIVFIGILATLFYSSFDLLSNLAADPNAMQIPGDLLSGAGAFEADIPVESWIQHGDNIEVSQSGGSDAVQGERWLEISGDPAADGALRLIWSEHFSVKAGQGLLLTAAMKGLGFDRYGIAVRWTETSDEESPVITEQFSLVQQRSAWSRIALESPAAVSEGFASAQISVVGISSGSSRGSLLVDQWVAKIIDVDALPAFSLKNESDQQRVTVQLDNRGVSQILRGRLEMISNLRVALGEPRMQPWGQLLPVRKETFVSGEDGSFRIGFELVEAGESAVVQQFGRAQDQRVDFSWSVQQTTPAMIVFRIKNKRLSLPILGFLDGIQVATEMTDGKFNFFGDEFSIGEGNQQVVLAMSESVNWSGNTDPDNGDLIVSADHGMLEAGGAIDLSISASSAREQETLNKILIDLDRLLSMRKEGDAYRLMQSARNQMGWRDDLDSRMKVYQNRLDAEISAIKAQLKAVQDDIRRYPGSPAENFLVEICKEAQVRFAGLDISDTADQILSEIDSLQDVQEEKSALGKLQTLLSLAEKAVDEERGELARFYYQHVIDSSPDSEAASEAEQGIKIVEAKGI